MVHPNLYYRLHSGLWISRKTLEMLYTFQSGNDPETNQPNFLRWMLRRIRKGFITGVRREEDMDSNDLALSQEQAPAWEAKLSK